MRRLDEKRMVDITGDRCRGSGVILFCLPMAIKKMVSNGMAVRFFLLTMEDECRFTIKLGGLSHIELTIKRR